MMLSSDENGQYEFNFEESFTEVWYDSATQPQGHIGVGVSDKVELEGN